MLMAFDSCKRRALPILRASTGEARCSFCSLAGDIIAVGGIATAILTRLHSLRLPREEYDGLFPARSTT